jgi:uncharacterized protein
MIASLDNRKYRFVRLAALVFSCLLLGNVSLRAQTTQSPVPMPNPPTPVVDNADVIDAATEQRLNNILKNLSENKTANVEMGVVTVRTTGGQDIFEYSLAIMRGWGVGLGEKGGLLLVVAVDDRKYFTQVSRHLEGDMPDGLVGQIQRERLVPQFKQGNYNQGIADTAEAYVATLAQKRGFSLEGIDQRKAYRDAEPATTGRRTSRGFSMSTIVIIIIIVLFLLISSRGGGGGGGCGGGGCLNMLLLNSLLNSGRGGWGSSGWGGGGFGSGSGWGGGGGGGSDWGGFSGGGGDAGGGGAGGDW